MGSEAAQLTDYHLEDQIGFVLRRAFQRHASIFQEQMPEGLTATQFAALVRLSESGPCSQNQLGRLTAMDFATIKGVVDRLESRSLVTIRPDPADRRRHLLELTRQGHALLARAVPAAIAITRATLAPLNRQEQTTLLKLLSRIA